MHLVNVLKLVDQADATFYQLCKRKCELAGEPVPDHPSKITMESLLDVRNHLQLRERQVVELRRSINRYIRYRNEVESEVLLDEIHQLATSIGLVDDIEAAS